SGEHAAQRGSQMAMPEIPDSRLLEDVGTIDEIVGRDRGGRRISEIKDELGDEMNSNVAVFRTQEGLEHARETIRSLQEQAATEPKSALQEFTLRIRRYNPETGAAPYWEDHTVELEPHRSVLEGILQARARFDGSIGIRCSCRGAICGSCGVRINGQPGLACHTHLDKAQSSSKDGTIIVEPMGNMPVIKDLVVDMDAVHWKKVQRVTPWLVTTTPIPEREYIVPHE